MPNCSLTSGSVPLFLSMITPSSEGNFVVFRASEMPFFSWMTSSMSWSNFESTLLVASGAFAAPSPLGWANDGHVGRLVTETGGRSPVQWPWQLTSAPHWTKIQVSLPQHSLGDYPGNASQSATTNTNQLQQQKLPLFQHFYLKKQRRKIQVWPQPPLPLPALYVPS